jgi:4-hydroxy-4-methyl-2-oxoglutarate aldolase
VPHAARRIGEYDSGIVSDAMESLGHFGAINGIKPVWPCGRISGSVVTVRLRRLAPGEVSPPGPHLGARAIESARPGDILIVAHEARTDSAGWGGLLSAAAVAAGVGGVIVDGACRDVDEAQAAAFPVYARSVTPITARGRTVEAESGAPVDIAGITVRPGDAVVADASGVVIVPQDMIEVVVARAQQLSERESMLLEAIREGMPPTLVLDSKYDGMLAKADNDLGRPEP